MKHRVGNDNEDLELNQPVLIDLHIRAILAQFERKKNYMLNPSEEKIEEIRLHNEHIIHCEDALSISSKGCIQKFKDLTRYDRCMTIFCAHDNEDPENEQATLIDLNILAILMQIERQQKYVLNPSEAKKEEIRLHNEQIIRCEDALSISSKECIQRFKDSYLISNTELDIKRKKQLEIERKKQLEIERKNKLKLNAKSNLNLNAKSNMNLNAKSDLKLNANSNLKLNAKSKLKLNSKSNWKLIAKRMSAKSNLKLNAKRNWKLNAKRMNAKSNLKLNAKSKL